MSIVDYDYRWTMFETLPQHPQHPQQQSTFFPCRNIAADSYSYSCHAPARPSPLGPHNANVSSNLASSSSRCSFLSSSSSSSSRMMTTPTKGGMAADPADNASPRLFFSEKENAGFFQQQQQNRSETEPTSQKRTSPYEQRYKSRISNPLNKIFGSSFNSSSSSTSGENGSSSPSARRAAAKHRELFLNKLKRDRDEDRFNARGEQLMRMECLSEQRQWGEAMRRDAEGLFREYHLEEVVEKGEEEMAEDPDQYILDELLSQEQEMEEALLENMITNSDHRQHRHHQLQFNHQLRRDNNNNNNNNNAIMTSPTRSDCTSLYSDDDVDYDAIFRDLVDDDGQICHSQSQSQDMDMTG
ncbi:hypothetical protein VTN77DRAFT_7510 [Rasamsonia byssochlamydoides]|uniref:uncharacterized protein n=1 Tax=Rasamsonia byssochlamydoides TaxID=89139 RepID=UPI003742B8FC